MIRTPIAGLGGQVGETVTIAGWVQVLRLQRAMQFVVVRDHTGAVQVTHRRDGGALEAALDALTTESAIRVTGRVKANPVVSLGGLELIPDELVVESLAQAPLPIDSRTGPEGRLDWRFLDVRRRPAARLVFEVQTTVERAPVPAVRDLDGAGVVAHDHELHRALQAQRLDPAGDGDGRAGLSAQAGDVSADHCFSPPVGLCH